MGDALAHLIEHDAVTPESQIVHIDDLVVVAEFRDRIYTGLERVMNMNGPTDGGSHHLRPLSVVDAAKLRSSPP